MKKLLFSITKKDFEVQTFKSGGPGGQHQNKTESGVRIIHKASGAVGGSRTHKSQHSNKKEALRRLTNNPKFKLWLHRIAFELTSGKTIEERVEEQCKDENIKVEIVNEEGKWEDINVSNVV